MPPQQGQFIWYDLATQSLDAQVRFYETVVGWKAKDAGQPGMRYLVLTPPAEPEGMGTGGMMEMPKEMCDAGMKPTWNGYVWVNGVDAFAARVEKMGGNILQPPADIPGVGRFSFVSDPQGACFYLFQPNGEGKTPPPDHTPGYIGWRELVTSDWKAAFAFYAELFAWKKGDTVDMGPQGTYQLWTAPGGQQGGMMNRFDPSAKPTWGYYFSVAGVVPAVERVKAQGGKIVHGPQAVPGGGWIANGFDPQGVAFAITGPQGA